MASPLLALRGFNRFYTRKIGILQAGHLSSPFSLTEVRVLYELAHREQPTAAELCKELELDPGYLSRMLRSFEKQLLLRKVPSANDARQALLALTAYGRKQFDELDSRANEQVAKLPTAVAKRTGTTCQFSQRVEALLGSKQPLARIVHIA